MFKATTPRLIARVVMRARTRTRRTTRPPAIPRERRPILQEQRPVLRHSGTICTSLIDGPLFVPGYDFLGRPLDDNPTKEASESTIKDVAKPAYKQITKSASTKIEVDIQAPQAPLNLTKKSPWTFFQASPGTTYYETYISPPSTTTDTTRTPLPTNTPGFLQRLLYGVPDPLLTATAKSTCEKRVKKPEEAASFWHRFLHGVPERVLIAEASAKMTAKKEQEGEWKNMREGEEQAIRKLREVKGDVEIIVKGTVKEVKDGAKEDGKEVEGKVVGAM